MTTSTAAGADVAVVPSGFEALAHGDLAAFADMFHPDATWNHRNDDRLGGLHHGSDGIIAFITESVQLTGGTLRPMPQSFMGDGESQVCVPVHITGTRPDGRSFDDQQVLLFRIDSDQVRTVDQFVGDPAAVTAFWA
ncbi:MAG TPA: nuclear transport factor 2 family protein [Streptosporangiaceae bacterium]|nr:nuclear transport factor 2 family protein [Streptosporangiaceae bacterium]